MTDLFLSLTGHPVVERIGWSLIHSVWECATVGALLAVVLAILPKRAAAARYFAGCLALAICPVAPLLTTLQPPNTTNPALPQTGVSQLTFDVDLSNVPPAIPDAPRQEPLKAALPWAVIVWIGGVLLISIRNIGGWLSVHRMRRRATSINSRACAISLERLIGRLRISRKVLLRESADVSVPSLIGWVRPMILLPCGALMGLDIQHLEAILAHELAHVRRHDYLLNLIQTAIETLLFYHPAIWWISRQIRLERENCCDDLAVNAIGNVQTYSQALAAMEGIRSHRLDPALAATGGSLLHRIRRLLQPEPRRANVAWPAIIMAGIILGVVACSQVMAPHAQAQAQPTPTVGPATAPAVVDNQPVIQTQSPAAPIAPTPWIPPIEQQLLTHISQGRMDQGRMDIVDMQMLLNEAKRQLVETRAQAGADDPKIASLNHEIEALTAQLRDGQNQLGAMEYSTSRSIGNSIQVPQAYYISGTVKGGMYPMGPENKTTLQQAVVDAGGYLPGSDNKYVLIVRQNPVGSGKKTERIGLVKDVQSSGLAATPIYRGDVIMLVDQSTPLIPTDGRYQVAGAVAKPGTYPLVRGMTLLQALVAAGVNPSEKADATVVLVNMKSKIYGNAVTGEYPMSDMITSDAGSTPINPDSVITVHDAKTPVEKLDNAASPSTRPSR